MKIRMGNLESIFLKKGVTNISENVQNLNCFMNCTTQKHNFFIKIQGHKN